MASQKPEELASVAGEPKAVGNRLRGGPAVRLHLTLAVGLAICTAAFVFEVSRALGGNTLSWAYVFEWPIFAVFAVYMWWNLLHDHDGPRKDGPKRGASNSTSPDVTSTGRAANTSNDGIEDDADLVAWQEYLRTMEATEATEIEEAERVRKTKGPTAG